MQSNPHSSRFNHINLWKKSIRNQKVTQGGEGLALSREDSNSKNPLDQDKFFFTLVPRTADKKRKFYAA